MRELTSIERGDGFRLAVLQTPEGDVVLRIVDPSGQPSKRWYMRVRRDERAVVADALGR